MHVGYPLMTQVVKKEKMRWDLERKFMAQTKTVWEFSLFVSIKFRHRLLGQRQKQTLLILAKNCIGRVSAFAFVL